MNLWNFRARKNIVVSQVKLLILGACCLLICSGARAQQPFGDAKPGGHDENNKVAIRSVLRIIKSSQQPFIEFAVTSDRPFPVLNSEAVLLIGKRVFHGGGYGDPNLHTLVFLIHPEDFAKTKNGERVVVAYEGFDPDKIQDADLENNPHLRVWKFGKLDKSKIDK